MTHSQLYAIHQPKAEKWVGWYECPSHPVYPLHPGKKTYVPSARPVVTHLYLNTTA
jgi:hypothetical protein